MPVYNFFTDPHLGTKRKANTTPHSARMLEDQLFEAAGSAIDRDMINICGGDLFDKAFNDEATILRGYEIASHCAAVLAGNHDEVNIANKVTSLRALEQMGQSVCALEDLGDSGWDQLDSVYFVPHHMSQKLFEGALDSVQAAAGEDKENRYKSLVLHCNYALEFDLEDNTLNLTRERAESLLNAFDRIWIGHDHNPKTDFSGKLIVMGNTHPTSFSDISDKFRYTWDSESNHVEKVRIWSEDEGLLNIAYGSTIPALTRVRFVDVVGTGNAEDAVSVAQFIREIWNSSDQLLAVRNSVDIADPLRDLSKGSEDSCALIDINQRIGEDLKGSDLLPLYRELSRVEGDSE